MKYFVLAIFLSACAFAGPQLSQTRGELRSITINNRSEKHVLVKVHCDGSNLSLDDDEHDFLVHPWAEVTAPVQMDAAKSCYVAGYVYVGSNEICPASSR